MHNVAGVIVSLPDDYLLPLTFTFTFTLYL
jgi:hypothetical protein